MKSVDGSTLVFLLIGGIGAVIHATIAPVPGVLSGRRRVSLVSR